MFDPSRPPSPPRPAASVILVRERPGGACEVFLLRRHRKASFMSSAFVFPGGRVDEGEDHEVAAIRELFEEAGVLLCDPELDAHRRAAWRERVNGNDAAFAEMLGDEALTPATGRLHYWARWITPSVEPKRFDATFYLARLPEGQTPSFDAKETVDELWATPDEAIERHRAGEIILPPPQFRTLTELRPDAGDGFDALVASARRRAAPEHRHPILPRFLPLDGRFALVLPWDPDYGNAVGEGKPMPDGHFLASGPSRFVLEGMTWRLEYAPSSLIAG